MRTKVLVSSQVEGFVKALSPVPRQAVRRAIKGLADDEGDRKQLDGRLAPCWRLRIGGMRVIYHVKVEEGERRIFCFFADYRATVYQVMEQLLASGLAEEVERF